MADIVQDNEESGDQECKICFCDLTNQELAMLNPCGHKFHAGCASEWLRRINKCPYCRKIVETMSLDFDATGLVASTERLVEAQEELVLSTIDIFPASARVYQGLNLIGLMIINGPSDPIGETFYMENSSRSISYEVLDETGRLAMLIATRSDVPFSPFEPTDQMLVRAVGSSCERPLCEALAKVRQLLAAERTRLDGARVQTVVQFTEEEMSETPAAAVLRRRRRRGA